MPGCLTRSVEGRGNRTLCVWRELHQAADRMILLIYGAAATSVSLSLLQLIAKLFLAEL